MVLEKVVYHVGIRVLMALVSSPRKASLRASEVRNTWQPATASSRPVEDHGLRAVVRKE